MAQSVLDRIERMDRISKIRKAVYTYLVFCKNRRVIDGDELLYIYSYLNATSSEAMLFILTEEDFEKTHKLLGSTRVTVIDLRDIVAKLAAHKDSFEWSSIEGLL